MITFNDILKQAGQTALDLDETNADMVWEFAFTTFLSAQEDNVIEGELEQLEEAFDAAVMNAGRARLPLAEFCANKLGAAA